MELFGPEFEGYKEEEEIVEPEVVPPPGNAGPAPKAVDKAKKGKLVAKSTGLKYQFQIMLSIGVPRAEIKKFADSLHWLTYFPPITIVSLVVSFCRCFMFLTAQFPDRPLQLWRTSGLETFIHHDGRKPLL